MLENPISIVLYNSIVWKYFPWYGNILETLEILWKLPYCGIGPVFLVNTGLTLQVYSRLEEIVVIGRIGRDRKAMTMTMTTGL